MFGPKAPSQFSLTALHAVDLQACVALSRNAGWNQLEDDWRRILAYEPEGCFAALVEEELAGTVTTTRYGTSLAWIGMMLVSPRYRRRGLATALMQASIEYLRSRAVQCIRLDATPEGLPVYQRLGFQGEFEFHRWQRPAGEFDDAMLQRAKPSELTEELLELDLRAFGADRRKFLLDLAQSSRVVTTEGGFGMVRNGNLAKYLGPIVAQEPNKASHIVESLLAASTGPIFWDVPSPNLPALKIAEALGFQPLRKLTRMRLGTASACVDGAMQNLFALADPAVG